MGSKLILLLVAIIFLHSCEKDKSESLNPIELKDTLLIIGETGTIKRVVDSTIGKFDEIVSYQIDLDLDGVDDFRFYTESSLGNILSYSLVNFDCLTSQSKVFCIDSVSIPKILDIGDTLSYSKNWKSEKSMLLSRMDARYLGSEEEVIEIKGVWQNVISKNIGVMIEQKDSVIYGWIEISIPNDDYFYNLEINEIGFK